MFKSIYFLHFKSSKSMTTHSPQVSPQAAQQSYYIPLLHLLSYSPTDHFVTSISPQTSKPPTQSQYNLLRKQKHSEEKFHQLPPPNLSTNQDLNPHTLPSLLLVTMGGLIYNGGQLCPYALDYTSFRNIISAIILLLAPIINSIPL